jgi:hypothetical protein
MNPKVWTSCYSYAESKLKIPHFTGAISVLINWQGWQLEDRTFGNGEKDLGYRTLAIRELLDEA